MLCATLLHAAAAIHVIRTSRRWRRWRGGSWWSRCRSGRWRNAHCRTRCPASFCSLTTPIAPSGIDCDRTVTTAFESSTSTAKCAAAVCIISARRRCGCNCGCSRRWRWPWSCHAALCGRSSSRRRNGNCRKIAMDFADVNEPNGAWCLIVFTFSQGCPQLTTRPIFGVGVFTSKMHVHFVLVFRGKAESRISLVSAELHPQESTHFVRMRRNYRSTRGALDLERDAIGTSLAKWQRK